MSDPAAVFEVPDTTAEWLLWWRGLVPERIGSPALSPLLLRYVQAVTEDTCLGNHDEPRDYYAEIVPIGPFDWKRTDRAVGVSFSALRKRVRGSVYRWLVQGAGVSASSAAVLAGYRTLRRAPSLLGASMPPMAPLPKRWQKHLRWRTQHDEDAHVA